MRSTSVVLLSALLLAAPAGGPDAAVAAAPSVSVTLSDHRDRAAPGDTLEYVATVTNDAPDAFVGSVELELPAFVTVVETTGQATEDTVRWDVEVPPRSSVDLPASVAVGQVPGDEYQVVALATVRVGTEVLVRAADVDAIPGAEAPPPVPGLSDDDASSAPGWLLPTVVAGGGLVGLVAAVAIIRRRRRPVLGRAA